MVEVANNRSPVDTRRDISAEAANIKLDSALPVLPPVQVTDSKAFQLYQAMHGGLTGLGTNEETVYRVLRGTAGPELAEIQRSYSKHYHRDLQTDLCSELGSEYGQAADAINSPNPDKTPYALTVRSIESLLGSSNYEGLKSALQELNSKQLKQVNEELSEKLGNGRDLQWCIRHNEFDPVQRKELLQLASSDLASRTAQLIKQGVNGMGTTESLVLSQLRDLSKSEIQEVEKAYSKISNGESLKDKVISELGGRDRFEASQSLKGMPGTLAEIVERERERYEFERKGAMNVVSNAVMDAISDKGRTYKNDFQKLDKKFEEITRSANPAANADEVQRRASFCSQDNESYVEAKQSAAKIASTGVAVGTGIAVSAIQPEVGLPLLYAIGSGATVYSGSNILMEGKAYDYSALPKDLAVGGASTLVAAKSLKAVELGADSLKSTLPQMAKTITTKTGISTADGALQGATIGTSDAALTPETWENGIGNGITNIAEQGAVNAVVGGTFGLAGGSLAELILPKTNASVGVLRNAADDTATGITKATSRELGVAENVASANNAMTTLKTLESIPEVGSVLDKPVGVSEGYTLREHTGHVLDQFEIYFAGTVSPEEEKLMRTTLAVHDAGKPQAYSDGNSHLAQRYTVELVNRIKDELSLDESTLRITKALLNKDSLGGYMKGEVSLEQTANHVRFQAKDAGIPVKDYFSLLTKYYQCDIGSYTADAGGRESLEYLFEYSQDGARKVFDPALNRMKFSPEYESLYNKLEETLSKEPGLPAPIPADQKLTYSDIQRLWEEIKDQPLLRHGTSAQNLRSIQEHGLDPRYRPYDAEDFSFYSEMKNKASSMEAPLQNDRTNPVIFVTGASTHIDKGMTGETTNIMTREIPELIEKGTQTGLLSPAEIDRLKKILAKCPDSLRQPENVSLSIPLRALDNTCWGDDYMGKNDGPGYLRDLYLSGGKTKDRIIRMLLDEQEYNLTHVNPEDIYIGSTPIKEVDLSAPFKTPTKTVDFSSGKPVETIANPSETESSVPFWTSDYEKSFLKLLEKASTSKK